jgi:hypothetical protein
MPSCLHRGHQVEQFHQVTSDRSTWGVARWLPDRVQVRAATHQLPLEGAAGRYRQAAEAWRACGDPLKRGPALFRDLGCRPLAAGTDDWLPHAEDQGGGG